MDCNVLLNVLSTNEVVLIWMWLTRPDELERKCYLIKNDQSSMVFGLALWN